MKIASITLKRELAYLCSQSITNFGLWVLSEPFLILPWSEITNEEKYGKIRIALEASKTQVVLPKELNLSNEVLSAFGFKSWVKFYKNSKTCSIRMDGDEITLLPMRYDLTTNTHEGIREELVRMTNHNQAEIFINVLELVLNKAK